MADLHLGWDKSLWAVEDSMVYQLSSWPSLSLDQNITPVSSRPIRLLPKAQWPGSSAESDLEYLHMESPGIERSPSYK